MPASGKDHRNAMLVTSRYGLLITHRTTRLHDLGHTDFSHGIYHIPEGKKASEARTHPFILSAFCSWALRMAQLSASIRDI